jgi:hypothetical protein
MNTNEPTVIPGNHEKISPTAIGVAQARSLSDIPYCKVIWDVIADKCETDPLSAHSKETHRLMAPYFEA